MTAALSTLFDNLQMRPVRETRKSATMIRLMDLIGPDDPDFVSVLDLLRPATTAPTASIALVGEGSPYILTARGPDPVRDAAGIFRASWPVTIGSGVAVAAITIEGGPNRAMSDAETAALKCAAQVCGTLLQARLDKCALAHGEDSAAWTALELERQRRMLTRIEARAKIGAWSVDTDTCTAHWSDQMFEIHGLSPGNPPTIEELRQFYIGVEAETAWSIVERAVAEGTPFEYEVDIVDRRGVRRKVHTIGGVEVVDGKTSKLFGISQDVTEIRSQESILQWQSMILDGATDSIIVFDLDGKILYWNLEAERVYGWSKADAIGANVAGLIVAHPDEHARIVEAVISDRRWSGSTTHRTRDGQTLRVDGTVTLAVTAEGASDAILCIFSDTAARTALDDEMQRRSRLDAVVELTGGVAHDFNNLLTVILSGADLMMHRLDPDDERILPLVKMSREAAERGRDLVSRMLAFARRQELEACTIDVNALIEDARPLLRKAVGENIDVSIEHADGLWKALVDPVKLEHAILTLCINARDAMDGASGSIRIALSNESLDAKEAATFSEVKPGDYVLICVTDDGRGMPAQTLARVFEPFFTTKTGTGSGLGLSMVYGFVKQSEGHIQVNSEVGVGTTIRIYLPRSVVPSGAAGLDEPCGVVRGRGEVVLAVEDDEEVRAHVVMMLETLGYNVIEASNGPKSVGILESGETVDLLFSDVVMSGGMSGIDVAERATLLRPELPIVLTSGFARFPAMKQIDQKLKWPLLTKPYTLEQLSEVLGRSLGRVGQKAL